MPEQRPERLWLPIVVLLVTAALWSLNGPLIKLLQQPRGGAPGLSGVTIACGRSLLGGIVFLPLLWQRRRRLRTLPWRWSIASVICFTLMTVTFVIATTRTAAANAIVLQYTSAIWLFVLSPLLLKERPRAAEGLVLVIAMAGVAVIFAGSPVTDLRWLAVALASGLGYGTLTITLRGLRSVSPLVVAGMNSLGSGLVLLPAVFMWGSVHMTATQWGLLWLMALVQFTLPYVMFSWALQRVPAYQAGLIVLLETVLNPLLTWGIVSEPVPPATLAGGPLIVVGVALWIVVRRRPGTKPVTGPDVPAVP